VGQVGHQARTRAARSNHAPGELDERQPSHGQNLPDDTRLGGDVSPGRALCHENPDHLGAQGAKFGILEREVTCIPRLVDSLFEIAQSE
jgi:hypothetical protein